MLNTVFWLLAAVGFVIQILCCVYGKNKAVRLLPMIAMGVIMAGTAVCGAASGGLGLFAGLALVWNELKILGMMILAYVLWAIVIFAKK